MLGTFFLFELRFWLRSYMLWIFFLVIGLMIFGATSTDAIRVGTTLENTYRNAPYVIQNFYGVMSILALLMTTAFVNAAAGRDFAYNTHQMLFSKPIRKFDYLVGRFAAATLVSIIPLLGVSAGVLLGKYMPWADAERWGPVHWGGHLQGILVFAIPNTIFIAAILFTIAALTRSTITSFIGALLLLVAYAVAESFLSDLDREWLAMLVDPFGGQTYSLLTKYWTVTERNRLTIGLQGYMLLNRLIWLAVGLTVFAVGYRFFSFSERHRKGKKVNDEGVDVRATTLPIPVTKARYDFGAQVSQFFGQIATEIKSTIRTTTFIVLLVAAMLNTVPSLIFAARELYGVTTLPVTYAIIDIIRGSLYLFIIAIITYFAGVLVWKERDAKCDEIHDAMPYPNWIPYVAKFISLVLVIVSIQALAMIAGVLVQAFNGYKRFQFDLYLAQMFGFDLLPLLFLAVMAFLIHVLSPNKYVGYFAFIAFLIANAFAWSGLKIATRMVRFGSTPGGAYSDLYGFAPFVSGFAWFGTYWSLFCGLLAIATILLWPRGKETGWKERLNNALLDFRSWKPIAAFVAVLWVAAAGWVYYNTIVLHHIEAPDKSMDRQSNYEKTYKKNEKLAQPRIRAVKYWIDIHPEQRNVVMRAEQVIENSSSGPIPEVHFSVNRGFDTEVTIDRASLSQDDKELGYRIYKVNPPMNPGEKLTMKYTVRSRNRGFENAVSQSNLVQNGTFFNNAIAPQIGYQGDFELSNRNERKKRGLPERDLMTALERNCTVNCQNTYISNNSDWVSVETIVSTSPDQMAIAPGSLQREWKENGRNYYQYKLDRDSLNFYSFISAQYEVARDEINGVKIEVYYHKDHAYNVPKMVSSIKKTLDYSTKNFGPYAHKQARIIEFPRFATFAQAFPGTMPYSEGIGFIADLKDPDDIDMVYYVVAHEMGHQWWAHQLIGADMQGATLMSETMAQYTALMVMEKEYGRDLMRKFLEYEMDRYLRARGRELLKERPLQRVESSQGYIHYQKGSVALYYLKEMIGEEAINKALRKMLADFAYKGPPYPTAHHMVDALREVTPPDLQYLIKDLFEEITLFSNRTLSARAVKRQDGKYDVSIEVESKKLRADEKGNETEVAVNDWMEIGAFAKPAKGKKYGATLYRERVRVNTPKQTFKFTVAELPDKAGIDPFHLLVDRIPDDNTKRPLL